MYTSHIRSVRERGATFPFDGTTIYNCFIPLGAEAATNSPCGGLKVVPLTVWTVTRSYCAMNILPPHTISFKEHKLKIKEWINYLYDILPPRGGSRQPLTYFLPPWRLYYSVEDFGKWMIHCTARHARASQQRQLRHCSMHRITYNPLQLLNPARVFRVAPSD